MSVAKVEMTLDVREAVAAIRTFVADCESRKRTLADVPDEELAQLVDQIRDGVHVRVDPELRVYGTPTTEFTRAFARAMRDDARKNRRAT